MKEWSLGFIFNKEFTHVILLKKSRTMHVGTWNGVGGKVEYGETPLTSMIRECMEETQMDIQDWTFVGHLEGTTLNPVIDVNEFWRVHIFAAVASKIEVDEVTAEYSTKAVADKPFKFEVGELNWVKGAPHLLVLMHAAKAKLQSPGLKPITLKETD